MQRWVTLRHVERLAAADFLRAVACVCLILLLACSSETPFRPVSPSTLVPPSPRSAPIVIATVSPVPMPMRAQGSSTTRYAITGEVTFRETAGIAGRITQLSLAVINGGGERKPIRVSLDLSLAPGGAVKQPIAEAVDLFPGEQPPLQLHVEGTGVDLSGEAFAIKGVEVPLTLERAPALELPVPDAVFVGAGDIAACGSSGLEGTARLLDRMPGTVFTLGDNAYPSGTAERFATCYEPTWGRQRARTNPAPGNHDWEVSEGAPYFAYYGPNAGSPGVGYYSFNLGAWHILSLNSNVPAQPGSAQYEWARRDLERYSTFCTLAYWHHPLFTSGPNGNSGQMRDMWRLLQSNGAEIVLSGHDHDYERFAPQDADGRPDSRGLREFVVGTGGGPLYPRKSFQPNSELLENQTWGVLKLTLRTKGYMWEFVPIAGQSFSDFGTGDCHP